VSNTVGYSIGCVTPVRYTFTQGEDVTGNNVSYTDSTCAPGCWNGDYRNRSYWAQIPRSATAVTGGTDYYGALAPTLFFYGGGTYRDICPTVCFCEGPVEEGATVTEYLGRYETRWMALLSEGLIYYGREDGTLIQVPLDLFPDPLSETATHIAMAFDANARPVFAYEDEGMIYVRRYVAGVPTFYSWTGINPCLFFNGVLESDDSLTDVVCYYLSPTGGALYARFQRENFGVADLVAEDVGFDSLKAVDRGRGVLASFMVIELSGKRIFAAVYPPWPILSQDSSCSSVSVVGGAYQLTVVTVSSYDSSEAVVSPIGGRHRAVLITLPTESDSSASTTIPHTGSYRFTLIQAGSYSDGSTSTTSPHTGSYRFTLIQAGSYSDGSTSTTSPQTGEYVHV